jgi:hypothetical protein
MSKPDDLPLVALDHDRTLVYVIEMSGTSRLVAATVPRVDRPRYRSGRSTRRAGWSRSNAGARRRRGQITRTVVAYERWVLAAPQTRE